MHCDPNFALPVLATEVMARSIEAHTVNEMLIGRCVGDTGFQYTEMDAVIHAGFARNGSRLP